MDLEKLTPHEFRVVCAFSEKKTCARAAAELGISRNAVKMALRNAYVKLGVDGAKELVQVAGYECSRDFYAEEMTLP